MWKRKRPQQHAIHQAVNRRRDSDAQRQRRDHNDRETRRPPQLAQCNNQIALERAEHSDGAETKPTTTAARDSQQVRKELVASSHDGGRSQQIPGGVRSTGFWYRSPTPGFMRVPGGEEAL